MPNKRALFDVKPVKSSGSIDFERISAVQAVVNLAVKKRTAPINVAPKIHISKPEPKVSEPETPMVKKPVDAREEFESALNQDADLHVELAQYGITAHQFVGRPRVKPILKIERQEKVQSYEDNLKRIDEYSAILTEIHQSRAAAARAPELRPMVALEKPVRTAAAAPAAVKAPIVDTPKVSLIAKKTSQPSFLRSAKPKKKLRIGRKTLISLGIVVLSLVILAAAGWILKKHVTTQGQSAVNQLENAKADLAQENFDAASQDFLNAYKDFSSAGNGLNFMGATISGLIAELPGGGTVKSAQNLVQIGKLVADSGGAMTQAAKALSGASSLFTPGQTGGTTISSAMQKLNSALSISSKDVADIKTLLASTDPSIIPADKREAFTQLSALVPTLEEAVGHGADYAKFFADASSQTGTHRYLILFENSAELRPTGGFPGSYAVVTFTDGQLADFKVDDIYNPDGQIKTPVVPPGPLQHITPDWGMRDANWFPDFPTSARVIEDFFQKETGNTVDGVITINPSLVTNILKVTGPIQMPQYGLTLTADNFVDEIQNQVEYVADRAEPKQIMMDLAPLLLAKLKTVPSEQWLTIYNSVIDGLDKKTVLMYFNNLNLETFADNQGFAGQLYQGSGDYVMPTISNIKGSKADAVTDTSVYLDTTFDGSDALHTLTITRTDNGGHEKYGFYNKQNPAYIRVLVPQGAQLVSIDGNDHPNFAPLLNYAKAGFDTEDVLVKWENSGVKDPSGVVTYQESGKSEFGFWLITDPGQTKTVTLTYRVPNVANGGNYNLYFQKQPGLVIKDSSIKAGDYNFSGPLDKDLTVKVQLP